MSWFRGLCSFAWLRERHVAGLAPLRDARRVNPYTGRCDYCGFTEWANHEQGQKLKMEPHDCPEGNGGPRKLAKARALP